MSTADKVKESMNKSSKSNGSLESMASMNTGQVGDLLGRYKLQIAQAMPKHLTADRLIQLATTLIVKNPEIAKCTKASIIGAVMQAAQLGFRPIEALGECYFVPYNRNIAPKGAPPQWVKEVQFQIGYKGLISLARRSGQIKSIHAFCVFSGDKFEYELGLNPNITHVPNEEQINTMDALTHAYAVAHYNDGGYNFVVLSKKRIEALRLRNPMFRKNPSPSGAWESDYASMACAKAIKQLAKYMPLSDEMQHAYASDEAIINPDDFAKDQSGTLENITYPDYEDATVLPDSEDTQTDKQ